MAYLAETDTLGSSASPKQRLLWLHVLDDLRTQRLPVNRPFYGKQSMISWLGDAFTLSPVSADQGVLTRPCRTRHPNTIRHQCPFQSIIPAKIKNPSGAVARRDTGIWNLTGKYHDRVSEEASPPEKLLDLAEISVGPDQNNSTIEFGGIRVKLVTYRTIPGVILINAAKTMSE